MTKTANLNLPYITAGQAQKHITHNEAIRALDAVVQLNVLDRNLISPPISLVDGDRYLVGAQATGDWINQDGNIAAWQDNSWMFYSAAIGWLCFVVNENKLVVFDGVLWNEISNSGSVNINPAPLIGINNVADVTNRLAVSSPNTLLSHEGSDHRVKINKAAITDTASFLLQTNYNGHAEIGLTGDNDLHFKVSPDGNNWQDALIIDKNDGSIAFPKGINSIAGGQTSGFRNNIINGGFSIWQRGETHDLSYAYKADRWLWFNVAGNGAGLISKSNDVPAGEGFESSLKLSLTSLPSSDDGFRQYFDLSAYKQLEGKIVTLSCWVKGPVGAEITADINDNSASVVGNGNWQKLFITAIIPAGLTSAWVGIFRNLQTNGDYYATGFQLELGEVTTPYELKPLALELGICRYYFRRYASAQNIADLAYEMRITPTQSGNGPYDYHAEI